MDLPVDGLSQRARYFLHGHALRLPSSREAQSAEGWLEQGVDQNLVQRAVDYNRRWGDLHLPPSMFYNGGPRYLGSDILAGRWSTSGYFEAGPARFSVDYDFLVAPSGVFGVGGERFIPLYQSVEGWVESLALEYLLRRVAAEKRQLKGGSVSSLDLSRMVHFPRIRGMSDIWLMGDEQVVFLGRGQGLLRGNPDDFIAVVYSGIPDWDIDLEIWD